MEAAMKNSQRSCNWLRFGAKKHIQGSRVIIHHVNHPFKDYMVEKLVLHYRVRVGIDIPLSRCLLSTIALL